MKIIVPNPVSQGELLNSNIPEPDPAVGEEVWTSGQTMLGEQRVDLSTHKIYEVVADPSTTDSPLEGVSKVPPTWVEIGPTNRYVMFDGTIGTQSIGSELLETQVQFPTITTSMFGVNIDGAASINVQVHTSDDELVYDRDVSMVDNRFVPDWYAYYFSPVIRRTEFLLTDLPSYLNAKISTTITGVGEVAVGALVYGSQHELGVALYGSSWQAMDFSRKERDEFGNFTIVRRRTADIFDYDVSVDKPKFPYVKDILKRVSTVPCVWIGSPGQDDGTTVYGYYKNVQINISSPTILQCTIQVEGLV